MTVGLALARQHGIEAVAMRRIADELGCTAMALYRHVGDRQELLLAMLDEVALRIEPPAPQPDPSAEIVAVMTAAHLVMARDPWVVTVLVIDGLASPEILPLVERLIAALRRAGLDGREALAAHATLWQFTYGEILTRHHERADAWNKDMVRRSDPARFPELHRAIAELHGGPVEGAQRERYAADIEVLVAGLLPPP